MRRQKALPARVYADRARWWSLHCEQSVSMRAIARQENLHASTVMRGIHHHAALLDGEEQVIVSPRPKRLKQADPLANVSRWFSRGKLDVAHVLAARRFLRDYKALESKLPQSVWEILYELLVEQRPVEQVERERGWASRSGKIVLVVLLTMLVETPRDAEPETPPTEDEVQKLKDQIDYLSANEPNEYLGLMESYGLTLIPARMLAILLRKPNVTVSKEALYTQIYANRPEADWPDMNIITSAMHYLRKGCNAANAPFSVQTVGRFGYKLVKYPEVVT